LHQQGNTKDLLINHLNKRFSVGTRNDQEQIKDVVGGMGLGMLSSQGIVVNSRYTKVNVLSSAEHIKTVDGLKGVILDTQATSGYDNSPPEYH
jgi:hypothetical protein